MTEEQVKDNPVKNFAVTGYLKEFTKELKEEKGIELHNQWRVELNDITDSGGVANLRKSIIRIY